MTKRLTLLTDVKSQPEVWFAADPEKTYTLVMIDPDVPSDLGPQVAHWVVSDLKPSCAHSVADEGKTLVCRTFLRLELTNV